MSPIPTRRCPCKVPDPGREDGSRFGVGVGRPAGCPAGVEAVVLPDRFESRIIYVGRQAVERLTVPCFVLDKFAVPIGRLSGGVS